MSKVTLLVQILQTKEDLAGNGLNETSRDTLSPVLLDEREEVFAEWLEDDADVGVEWRLMGKRVETRDYVGASGVVWRSVRNLLEELDLVAGRFCVTPCRFYDLEGGVTTFTKAV